MPDLTDYDPNSQSFKSIRTAEIVSGWTDKKLREFLKNHVDACIYSIISHDPTKGERIIVDGEPFIDQFGFHVFITQEVSWHAHDDVDERFNYDYYPEDLKPELYDYFDR